MRESDTIFTYLDPIAYLNAMLKVKQAKNPRFSIRAWAKALGLKEPTTLGLILKGKRAIPLGYVPALSISLGLNPLERKHLEAIIRLAAANDPAEKELWIRQIQDLFFEARFFVELVGDFELFHKTTPLVLLEIVDLREFREDFAWIRGKLHVEATEAEIAEAFANLLKLGFLVRKDGKLTRAQPHIGSQYDIASVWVKRFHEASLKQAISAVYRQGIDRREFMGTVMGIRTEDLSEAKKMMRAFHRRFISRFSVDAGAADAVYHLNMNFFAQTKEEIA